MERIEIEFTLAKENCINSSTEFYCNLGNQPYATWAHMGY